jgi:translation initiation factor 2 alpha subunit (eIF-2alpha)
VICIFVLGEIQERRVGSISDAIRVDQVVVCGFILEDRIDLSVIRQHPSWKRAKS